MRGKAEAATELLNLYKLYNNVEKSEKKIKTAFGMFHHRVLFCVDPCFIFPGVLVLYIGAYPQELRILYSSIGLKIKVLSLCACSVTSLVLLARGGALKPKLFLKANAR